MFYLLLVLSLLLSIYGHCTVAVSVSWPRCGRRCFVSEVSPSRPWLPFRSAESTLCTLHSRCTISHGGHGPAAISTSLNLEYCSNNNNKCCPEITPSRSLIYCFLNVKAIWKSRPVLFIERLTLGRYLLLC